jgi:apolipoprotein D and lipocalin family protein
MRRAAAFTAGLLLGALGARAFAGAGATGKPLATIGAIDVHRYLGTWYEIARYPNEFQRKCAGGTSASYSLREDGRIRVLNRCRRADGGEEVAEGVARQVGGALSPKLEVRFAPAILSFIPKVWGDYWVIDLDEDYQLAAVSEPSRRYLWILSRTRQADPALYQALLARLAGQGFDTSRLVPTPQGK